MDSSLNWWVSLKPLLGQSWPSSHMFDTPWSKYNYSETNDTNRKVTHFSETLLNKLLNFC